MKKLIVDDKVAVVYAPGWGAGWYSWHGIEALLFDPSLVYMVEEKEKSKSPEEILNWIANIEDYCKQNYGDDNYYGGAEDLVVDWLPVGTEFQVSEYDGNESLMIKDKERWIKA